LKLRNTVAHSTLLIKHAAVKIDDYLSYIYISIQRPVLSSY
jgi:hypothetical protein